MSNSSLFQSFPNLRNTKWAETSPIDPSHNCIAYAADVYDRGYWPQHATFAWPTGVPNEETIDAFKQLYRQLGYQDCPDGEPENGFDKVALYGDLSGVTHAAIFRDGRWKSKLGAQQDIAHELDGLNGPAYGYPIAFLRRPSKKKKSRQHSK